MIHGGLIKCTIRKLPPPYGGGKTFASSDRNSYREPGGPEIKVRLIPLWWSKQYAYMRMKNAGETETL